MNTLEDILKKPSPPALLIGNGINRYGATDKCSSWESLLEELARDQNLSFHHNRLKEMSNTEIFDILDLTQPRDDRSDLQRKFCSLMDGWRPKSHHSKIVGWARNRSVPIITVNFDENLSQAIGAKYHVPRRGKGFTDYYPWTSYFADSEIVTPRNSFAIWHAHGMKKYSRSIRLGLTHYMGAVQRARSWIYGKNGIRTNAKESLSDWPGVNTWLDPLFFSPLLIIGFGLGRDETFLRWLFIERARLHIIRPEWKQKTWYVTKSSDNRDSRAFFEELGIQMIKVESYDEIYDHAAWLAA